MKLQLQFYSSRHSRAHSARFLRLYMHERKDHQCVFRPQSPPVVLSFPDHQASYPDSGFQTGIANHIRHHSEFKDSSQKLYIHVSHLLGSF